MEEQGVVFLILEPDRAYWLREIAGLEQGGSFTDVVDAGSWNGKGQEIVLLSANRKDIEAIGLIRKSGRVATQKDRVSISHLHPLSDPISFEEILSRIPSQYGRHLERYLYGQGGRVPPGTWHQVLEVLQAVRQESTDVIANLRTLIRADRPWIDPATEAIIAQEKDAVNLALRASGLEPSYLPLWTPDDAPAPFLQGLGTTLLREDQQIQHDARVFGSWTLIGQAMVGVGVFEDPRDSNRLTVINVNRTAIEEVLGVDLIYYNQEYDSYVAVQYKRMDSNGTSTLGFRPTGPTYDAEIARMAEFEDAHPPTPWSGRLRAYRLNERLFYFKLCSKHVLEPASEAMLPGMYLPLEYWNGLIADPSTTGPRGGIRLTYENSQRHLNNTLFVQLVGAGWVGSRELATESITEIIRSSLAEGRSVMLAGSFRGEQAGA